MFVNNYCIKKRSNTAMFKYITKQIANTAKCCEYIVFAKLKIFVLIISIWELGKNDFEL